MNKATKAPFIVTLVAVLLLILCMFLPYMTATGDLAEYVNAYPDSIESYEPRLTAGDLKNISLISVGKVSAAAYGDAEGSLNNAVIIIFGIFLALTTLFTVIKKPIPTIVFDVLTCGLFLLIYAIMKYDFFGPDKYTWGIAFYTMWVSFASVLAGSIWTLVARNAPKQTPENIA